MQFCDESLTDYICDSYEREVDRGIPNEEVWEIVRQIAGAISYLHREGIYQMEIKPKNGIQLFYAAVMAF
jgi:serine/threonine protein kinase